MEVRRVVIVLIAQPHEQDRPIQQVRYHLECRAGVSVALTEISAARCDETGDRIQAPDDRRSERSGRRIIGDGRRPQASIATDTLVRSGGTSPSWALCLGALP